MSRELWNPIKRISNSIELLNNRYEILSPFSLIQLESNRVFQQNSKERSLITDRNSRYVYGRNEILSRDPSFSKQERILSSGRRDYVAGCITAEVQLIQITLFWNAKQRRRKNESVISESPALFGWKLQPSELIFRISKPTTRSTTSDSNR